MTAISDQLSVSRSFSVPVTKAEIASSERSSPLLTAAPDISMELRAKWEDKIEQFKINHRNLDDPEKQKSYKKEMKRLQFKMMFFRHQLDLLEGEINGSPSERLWGLKEDLLTKLKHSERKIIRYQCRCLSAKIERIDRDRRHMDINKFGKSLWKHQRKIFQLADEDPDKAEEYIECQMEKLRNKIVELDAKMSVQRNEKEGASEKVRRSVHFSEELSVRIV